MVFFAAEITIDTGKGLPIFFKSVRYDSRRDLRPVFETGAAKDSAALLHPLLDSGDTKK